MVVMMMPMMRTATQESVRFCTLPEQLSRYFVALCSSSRSLTSAYFMYACKTDSDSVTSPFPYLDPILFEVVWRLHPVEGLGGLNVSALKVVTVDLRILMELKIKLITVPVVCPPCLRTG